MLLWTGDNAKERKRQSIYDVLARTDVHRVKGPEPVRYGPVLGLVGLLLAAIVGYGGVLFWLDLIARWIAGRP